MERNLAQIFSLAFELYSAHNKQLCEGVGLISKSQANRMYGKENIARWLTEKRIKPDRLGSAKNSKLGFHLVELTECRVSDALNRLL